MVVRFRLLGDIGAEVAGLPVDPGPMMRRVVLAVLLVDPDRPVPPDVLADRVWGPDRPARAVDTLRSYVSRLRAVLPVDVDRSPAGYRVRAPRSAVDLHVFRDLLARARDADDAGAAASRAEAFGLWRGEPFAGVASPWLGEVRRVLHAELHAARLDHHDVLLRLGGHAELVPGLVALADEHPLDERLAGQLVLALHRSGRQADAVARYDLVRRRLAEELGVDPGAELREVRQRLLHAPTASRAPRRLPPAPAAFVGRAAELESLDRTVRRAGQVVVTGPGGVGKTWLALRWAHDAGFPDGVLHVDLRGFDPREGPLTTSRAVDRLLDGLGAGPAPTGLDARLALYRATVADRRMLVVLDDARDAAHVAPLLPGGTTCSVLVTSRNRLTSLTTTHGVPVLDLGPLDPAESRALLAERLPPTRLTGPVDELVRHCAGLPLALGIVAARAADHPLEELVEELREAPLDALDLGESSADLRTVLAGTCGALSPDDREALTALAALPGDDLTADEVAGLTGTTPAGARKLLRRLGSTHLVRRCAPDRYRLDAFVRLHVRERASAR
ncbi:AfsR/SARP family transcriptional regulator [Saccharothrix xinjiangensis]|uniref:BTAD domain-containing putative transcriptional regulator n=1 Tax=Saccharothrix xinjiangensis TaxID=204798 RepID=A0ABV9Y8T6_9PSEU